MDNELTLREMQDCELEILKYLSKICRENDLRYYLFYGTLIGAVRHKDFIPWDDDVDVVMLRDDYEKLINILRKSDKYILLTGEIDDYFYPFVKLVDPNTKLIEMGKKTCSQMGVWVDIFPLDKVPKNKFKQRIQFKLISKLVGLSRYSSSSEDAIKTEVTTFGKKIKYIISKLFSKKKILAFIDLCAKMYRNSDEYELSNLVWTVHYVTYLPEWFVTPVELPFRDGFFFAPSGYHDILVADYGDYLRLPPENQRHSNHNYKCWRKRE